MDIDKIMNFFYEKASRRIKTKINESGLKYIDICPNDSKQISWIVNNKRTKNNRFLITNAIICNTHKDEITKDYIKYGLLEKLKFNNIEEILWGTNEEINSYIFDLFELLWKYISDKTSPYGIDKDLFLCDYIPYAKYKSYCDILFSQANKYPALAYGIYEDDVVENIEYAEEQALMLLYKKCQQEFLLNFKKFANKTLSFHKIDKVFKENFIEKTFVPLLKKHIPNSSSLGIRVRTLIYSDLSHCASLMCGEKIENDLYLKNLINASSTYILALEKIQEDMFL